ncbi:MAG: O-antigen ligase family protein [Bradyrhizobiaceae bacterium]|nr:O-antigen ligase family protein [Bradyrhizobiaceae bacterium]
MASKASIKSIAPDHVRLAALADYLAAAVVISLPWSTSATSILVALWAVAAAATLDGKSLRAIGVMPAAALPLALVVLAFAGTLWSQAPWPEALSGISPFLKLLVIPLLFVQFSRSDRSETMFYAFLTSAGVLLAVSCLIFLFPQIPLKTEVPGVPVKDYILQSIEFTLCGFALFDRAIAGWGKSRAASLLLAALGILFFANIVFVVLGRTSIVIIAVLFGLLGVRHFRRRALTAFVAAGMVIAAAAWTTSPYLRSRVTHIVEELDASRANLNETSSGIRVAVWKMSAKAIADAPLFGHGTGSIATMFARMAAADPALPDDATNPHNQILATAVQLGLLGVAVLLAMWTAHLRMFLLPGPAAWIGLSIVAENVVGSLFNSHLFDFSHGWLYVFGLGIAGGVMLRKRSGESRSPTASSRLGRTDSGSDTTTVELQNAS